MHNLNDRALKERIIGAAVLVVLAILIVPVFLDGPSDETDVITESVTLPGQNDQDRTQQTIVLDRDRSQPVPATRSAEPEEATPEPQQPVQEESPAVAATASTTDEQSPDAESTAPAAIASPPPAAQSSAVQPSATQSSTGMWAVQLGSFSNKENAERLAADLRDQGFAAFLSEIVSSGNALQRVRIGPQKDRVSAEAIASQLARAGHEGRVVPHP